MMDRRVNSKGESKGRLKGGTSYVELLHKPQPLHTQFDLDVLFLIFV
jgi:hypothetical protein